MSIISEYAKLNIKEKVLVAAIGGGALYLLYKKTFGYYLDQRSAVYKAGTEAGDTLGWYAWNKESVKNSNIGKLLWPDRF